LAGVARRRTIISPRTRALSASLFALILAGFLVPALAWADSTPPVDLSASGQAAHDPQVAVDSDGDAVFTWRRFDGSNWRIQAQVRSATGILSAVQDLSEAGQDALDPQVAVDPDGDAVFTWRRFDGSNWRIQAQARSAAGALSAVGDLSDPGRNALEPRVAVDDTGDAVFAWRRSDGTNTRIQARARSDAGALSAVQTLSKGGQNAVLPQVAVYDAGDAVFAWRRFDGSNLRIQSRASSAAAALSAVQNLSDPGQDASAPQVAVDADNDAAFAWQRSDGSNVRIQARARSAAGALSPVQNLSDSGRDAVQPQVAVDDAGDAVFAWRRHDGSWWRIQARARSAAAALGAVQNLSLIHI
jgi:hypothetical protein